MQACLCPAFFFQPLTAPLPVSCFFLSLLRWFHLIVPEKKAGRGSLKLPQDLWRLWASESSWEQSERREKILSLTLSFSDSVSPHWVAPVMTVVLLSSINDELTLFTLHYTVLSLPLMSDSDVRLNFKHAVAVPSSSKFMNWFTFTYSLFHSTLKVSVPFTPWISVPRVVGVHACPSLPWMVGCDTQNHFFRCIRSS